MEYTCLDQHTNKNEELITSRLALQENFKEALQAQDKLMPGENMNPH